MRNIVATGNLNGEMITVKQISKAEARKLFCAGETIYLQACMMKPFNSWQSVVPVKLDSEDLKSCVEYAANERKRNRNADHVNDTPEKQFKQAVSDYEWYNCDSQRGAFVNYYKSI